MLLSIVAAACVPDTGEETATRNGGNVVGHLQDATLDEASGLARSQRYPNVLWAVNDDGPPLLYAIDGSGRNLGHVTITDASNRDWEDLASFTLDDVPYLIVADIGDNDSRHEAARLYVVEEPEAGDTKIGIAWRIEFSYPGGARDAEAIAVDVEQGRILVMSKRDLPPRLYSLPLVSDDDTPRVAALLGTVESLPQPGRFDVPYHWQPTGMDISDDGSRAIVLTYSGVYLYEKNAAERWIDALGKAPTVISEAGDGQAESITFDKSAGAVYITLEQRNSPLFRLPLYTGDSP